MPYIRVKSGLNKGKIYEVKEAVLTIGRDENQTIQILDQGVSRQHAEIFRIGEMCFVRDLGSTNGTLVNSVRITEEVLKSLDELLIGTTILIFEDQPLEGAVSGSDMFESTDTDRIAATTVELKVEKEKRPKEQILGKEVESRNLTLTAEIAKVISSEHDLYAVLHKTVELIFDAVRADAGYLLWIDRATGKLQPKVFISQGGEGADKKLSRTIVKRVLQTGRPILTGDATADQRFLMSDSVRLKQLKSVLCAPVSGRDRIEGLLYFHSSRDNFAFMVEDLELATSGALQLSLAMTSFTSNEQVKKGLMSTIKALVSATEIVDPKNQGHGERVAEYATVVAGQLGLPREEIYRIQLASLLHDVGKLAVHHSVVGVTKETIKQQHVYAGEKILNGVEGFGEIIPGIRYHHERADGSGYPYKVANAQTPMMARVIIVVNAFDNGCSWGGVGGEGIPTKDVLKDMAQRGGKEFDDDVIKALLICHRNGSLYTAGTMLKE